VSEFSENREIDKYLVDRVLGGDTNAFSVIVKNTEGLVTQIIFKMIRPAEDRKDIAQDIYLKAFKNLSGFRYQSKLSTWIAQIAYHTCLSHLEKKKEILFEQTPAKGKHNDDSPDLAGGGHMHSLFNQTERDIFQRELNEILESEIERLSPVYQTLIALYHNEDLSYEEIARVTRLPVGTVKNYLFRARKLLKDRLLRKYKINEPW
jgi:RNA polymerase sigma factor (sigma-70 family)